MEREWQIGARELTKREAAKVEYDENDAYNKSGHGHSCVNAHYDAFPPLA